MMYSWMGKEDRKCERIGQELGENEREGERESDIYIYIYIYI